MAMLRIMSGFLALLLTLLTVSLLVGPFIPALDVEPLSFWQHLMYAIAGIASGAASISLWIWAVRGPSS